MMKNDKVNDMKNRIEEMRKELSMLYIEGINKEEVLQLSREMDKLIVEYQKFLKKG